MFNLEDFLRVNPNVLMVDSIDTIRTMIDRFKTYSLIQDCDFETKGEIFSNSLLRKSKYFSLGQEFTICNIFVTTLLFIPETVFVPPFVVLESDKLADNVGRLRVAKVEFPLGSFILKDS